MVPDGLLGLFEDCRAAGGRALVVGGGVRDALMGHPSKDIDIEVHGLDPEALHRVLSRWGPVNEVGRSFGVLKLRWRDHELDVSLPRRDSRQGVGHKGIRATADPHLGIVEAARRRDLTINAIAYDPLERSYEDPFDGRLDLARRRLRAVDPTTFGEDPLRALRVAQFAARFQFEVDPDLLALCREMPLHELPAERIRGEVEKLLLRGRAPSVGWEVARAMGAWAQVLPEWDEAPEELDRCAREPVGPEPRRLALLYAAACGRTDREGTVRVLDRLRVHRVGHFRVRDQVLFMVTHRDDARGGLSDAAIRRLAESGDVGLVAHLIGSDLLARRAEALGVGQGPLSILVTGRDVKGVPPGPLVGQLLAEIREEQIEGRIRTREEALAWLREHPAIEPPS